MPRCCQPSASCEARLAPPPHPPQARARASFRRGSSAIRPRHGRRAPTLIEPSGPDVTNGHLLPEANSARRRSRLETGEHLTRVRVCGSIPLASSGRKVDKHAPSGRGSARALGPYTHSSPELLRSGHQGRHGPHTRMSAAFEVVQELPRPAEEALHAKMCWFDSSRVLSMDP